MNLHEQSFRSIYKDENPFYEELLIKDGSVSIHDRNIPVLATKCSKIKNGLLLEVFTEIFARETESNYNLRW